jgi:outer membrane protein assembly factor BamD (BamD/ComL family)
MRRAFTLPLLLIVLVSGGCRSLSRELNDALPDFLRSTPGADEMKILADLKKAEEPAVEDSERQKEALAELRQVRADGDFEECADLAADFTDEWPSSSHDEEVRMLRADSLYRDDDWSECFAAWREYFERYPVSEHANTGMETLYRVGLEYIEGRRAAFFGVFSRVDKGEEILRYLVETFPGGARAADAQWLVARHSLQEGDWQAAAMDFQLLAERWPDSAWQSAALYYTSWCRYRAIKGAAYDPGMMRLAREGFERYLEQARHQGWAGEAKATLAELTELQAEHLLTVAEWYIDQGEPWAARWWLMKLDMTEATTRAGKKAKELLNSLPMPPAAATDTVAPPPAGNQ